MGFLLLFAVNQNKFNRRTVALSLCFFKSTENYGHNCNIKRAVKKLLQKELLEYTIPEKLRSSNQKYKITAKGLTAVKSKD